MNIAHRIQTLRKAKGISQEALADKIGVSRQAVSKWESEQSIPDIEKIIILSDYFNISTDYLLKGIESKTNIPKEKIDAGIFAIIGTAINYIGIITAVLLKFWGESGFLSIMVGLIASICGCVLFSIGQFTGANKKRASKAFALINVCSLSLIPISFVCSIIQIGSLRLPLPLDWTLIDYYISPFPQITGYNTPKAAYIVCGLCWLLYLAVCIVSGIIFVKQYLNHKNDD